MEALAVQGEISSRILTLRGQQVILDRDLADLYQVETRRLNEQVKRNLDRFPDDFMFQLTDDELKNWKSQFATSNKEIMGMRKALYAFTEEGIYMLATVLRSSVATQTSIHIIRTFKKLREYIKGYPVVGVPLVDTLDVNIKMNYNIMQAKGNHKGLPLQVDNAFILGFLK